MQERLMVTCIIDEMEERNATITDIPGAFLHMDMVHGDHTVYVRICCVLADILVRIDPSNCVEKLSWRVNIS